MEQNSLNEISLEDIEFTAIGEQNINVEVAQTFPYTYISDRPSELSIPQIEAVHCRSFWIENTKDLILYLWNEHQSEAIIVPKEGWMIRDDIMVH